MITFTIPFPVSTSISRTRGRRDGEDSPDPDSKPDDHDDDTLDQVYKSSTNMISAPTSTSNEYPPLTTLFTPDPSCSSFYVNICDTDNPAQYCVATAFPAVGCLDESSQRTTRSYLACYPSSAPGLVIGISTYSPGYFCPVGMTTVESVSVLSGAWCCLNGFTWSSSRCQKATSQATLISTNVSDCTSQKLMTVNRQLSGNNDITLLASPILLTGQKFPMTTPFTSRNSISSTKTIIYNTGGSRGSISNATSGRPSVSTTAVAWIVVSGIIGIVSLLLLAFFCIRRRRKALAAKNVLSEKAAKIEPDKFIGKPELEGSKAYVYTVKPELDAAAIRAELEGDVSEPHGDGIYVLKPELEGTVGSERYRGVHVRKKPELAAASKPCAISTQHNIAELEAVAPSTGGGPVQQGLSFKGLEQY
ncbi:hypothetical protein EV127DRAFT_513411 [Xylaria flabelliformis]|nr:hypothetical protein EV127DRAFT_513411 [Xylaria flabelliformis]